MKVIALFAICCVLLTSQCTKSESQLDPKIARLVGTWVLAKPDSAAGTTLVCALDVNNPPHDITSFNIEGNGQQRTYTGRIYATIDGTMQFQQIAPSAGATTDLAKGEIEQTYLTKLQSVARYQQSTDSTLTLYFGRPGNGILSYKKSR